MEYQEIEMTDVIIVLDELDDDQTQEVVKQLAALGVAVDSVDNDNSVVEGCVASARLHEVHKVVHVRYVRNVLTYASQKPVEGTEGKIDVDGFED